MVFFFYMGGGPAGMALSATIFAVSLYFNGVPFMRNPAGGWGSWGADELVSRRGASARPQPHHDGGTTTAGTRRREHAAGGGGGGTTVDTAASFPGSGLLGWPLLTLALLTLTLTLLTLERRLGLARLAWLDRAGAALAAWAPFVGREWRATWVDMQGDAIDWARWAFPAAAAAPRRERASAAEAAALPAEIFVPVIELEGWGAARLRAELDQLMVRAGACSPTAARGALIALTRPAGSSCSDKGVRLAQNMRVGPCIHVGILVQLQKAEIGPTSGPTWRLSHLGKP